MNDEQVQCLMAAIIHAGRISSGFQTYDDAATAAEAVSLFRAVTSEARKTPKAVAPERSAA